MKRFLLASSVVATLMSGGVTAQADTFKTQRCMNMGNALDAPKEGEWGHVIKADSFRAIKAAGFDTVRIPIRWSAHTGGGPDYRIDPRFFRRVDTVVNQALSQGLQVIINVHHFEELNEDPDANFAKFIALWGQIAPHYASLPDSVYFEVLNEPNGKLSGDVMRRVLTAGFKKIRESNPTRILILGGENWSGINSLPSIPAIKDPNQVYTFHYYDPFEFTHQKASWTDLENSGTVRWGSAADHRQLKEAAAYVKKAQKQLGFPLFLGEIGAYQKAPYEDVVRYTAETRKAFEAAGLSWCAWSFTATFPFYDQDTKQWDYEKLGALGLGPKASVYNKAPVHNGSQNSAAASHAYAAPSYKGQSLDNVFVNMQKALGRKGQLMTSPFIEDLQYYGPASFTPVKDNGVPDGKALEVRTQKGVNPWDSALTGTLITPIKKGDTLLMSYWAKAVRGPGQIASVGLQLADEPYSALKTTPETFGREWKQYYVTVQADRNYRADELGYTLQVAGAAQTLRVGPILVMNLGQNVPQASLPE
jgi:endoglucanase